MEFGITVVPPNTYIDVSVEALASAYAVTELETLEFVT